MDKIDRAILKHLVSDCKITLRQLASSIGLSVSPLQARIKKLEDLKYILGYQARINHTMIGEDHIAFVQVSLSDTRAKALEEFNIEIGKLESVEQCHMIAGSFDYLLKVRTSNIESYRFFLSEKISSLPHVASTSTFVSMQSVKE